MAHDPDIRWIGVEFPGLGIVMDDRFDNATFNISDFQRESGGQLFDCLAKVIVPGGVTTVTCRDVLNPATAHSFDPLALRNTRLNKTLGQLDPPPDFVRLSVVSFWVDRTFGGSPGCQSLDIDLGGCLPAIDGYFDYDVEAPGLYFPFDVTEEQRGPSGDRVTVYAARHHDCPSGNTAAHVSVNGQLRREAGLEGGYEGTPAFNNIGMDVLIPWSEYAALGGVTLSAQGHDLNYLTTRTNFSTFTTRGTALSALAYRYLDRPSDRRWMHVL